MIMDLISITKELVLEERKQRTVSVGLGSRCRTFATPTLSSLSSDRPRYHASAQSENNHKACIRIPEGTSLDNLHETFQDLVTCLDDKHSHRDYRTKCEAEEQVVDDTETRHLEEGVRVKVFWTEEEENESGWHEGWYTAVIKEILDEAAGEVKLVYVVEPTESYDVCINDLLEEGKLKFDDGNEIEQFFEIGAN